MPVPSIEDFQREIAAPETLAGVRAVMSRLSEDSSLAEYQRKLTSVRPGYWDLACALSCLARTAQPDAYLEIGVRRGKSLAQVVTQQPRCAVLGIDLWISPYGGVSNPGPSFVEEEMRRLGHMGTLELLSGDSHQLLPQLASRRPERRFDLITVDGDHSDEGARSDLEAALGLLRPGGWLVFDDLSHPAHTLLEVWRRFEAEHAKIFDCSVNLKDHNGTAVARLRGTALERG